MIFLYIFNEYISTNFCFSLLLFSISCAYGEKCVFVLGNMIFSKKSHFRTNIWKNLPFTFSQNCILIRHYIVNIGQSFLFFPYDASMSSFSHFIDRKKLLLKFVFSPFISSHMSFSIEFWHRSLMLKKYFVVVLRLKRCMCVCEKEGKSFSSDFFWNKKVECTTALLIFTVEPQAILWFSSTSSWPLADRYLNNRNTKLFLPTSPSSFFLLIYFRFYFRFGVLSCRTLNESRWVRKKSGEEEDAKLQSLTMKQKI